MALSDGNFDRLEQQFVDKITDYGDLLTYIKQDSQGRLDLTWSQVASLREETQASLVQALPAILDKLCDSFVKPLALVDKVVDDVDFLQSAGAQYRRDLRLPELCGRQQRQGGGRRCSEVVAELLGTRWRKYMR